MKKLFIAFGVLALVGFGCAAKQPEGQAPIASPVTSESVSETTSPSTEAPTEAVDLGESPAITPLAKPIDDSTWVKTTTHAGVTVTAPTKGSYAPTWTFAIIPLTDEHLQENCYVTVSTTSQKTTFSRFENACQTTTDISGAIGTRVDYFTMKVDTYYYLFTFTKVYPDGFSMNDYAATLDHVISLIK